MDNPGTGVNDEERRIAAGEDLMRNTGKKLVNKTSDMIPQKVQDITPSIVPAGLLGDLKVTH